MYNYKEIQPFVKWAGGKRQLLEEIKKRMPQNYNTYYEPFLGGGAVLLELQPKKAVVGDINSSLINVYKIIREHPTQIIEYLSALDANETNKEIYYSMRELYNEKIKNNEYDIEQASLFIFLNKRCFNGLYRVNSKGFFNVPYNDKKFVNSFSEANIINISEYLKKIKIINNDFEIILKNASKDDFIFLDSPYAPLNPKSFESYTKEGFSLEDHIRLSKVFKKLDDKGCHIMLTNHNTKLIRELYNGYNIDTINVKRMINSDASKRKGEEVIITNYDR